MNESVLCLSKLRKGSLPATTIISHSDVISAAEDSDLSSAKTISKWYRLAGIETICSRFDLPSNLRLHLSD